MQSFLQVGLLKEGVIAALSFLPQYLGFNCMKPVKKRAPKEGGPTITHHCRVLLPEAVR